MRMLTSPLLNRKGQATIEYLLMIGVAAAIAFTVLRGLKDGTFGSTIRDSLIGQFRSTYQFGDPQAKDDEFNNGDYSGHPRAEGESNFKLFVVQKR